MVLPLCLITYLPALVGLVHAVAVVRHTDEKCLLNGWYSTDMELTITMSPMTVGGNALVNHG